MTCATESDLIRLVSGELNGPAEAKLRDHLRDCARCALLLAELRATWDMLGTWEEPTSAIDHWSAIREGLVRERRGRLIPLARGDLLRAAASVAFALGLGWTTGWLVGRPAPTLREEPALETLIEPLGLDELAGGSAAGVTNTLLSAGEDEGTEQS